MPKFNVTRATPFAAEDVFAIIADVKCYKEFLPLMTESRILRQRVLDDGRESVAAVTSIVYDKLRIHETMHSDVVIDRANRIVTATSEDGPIKSLATRWQVRPLDSGGSEIEFSVDYSLKSRSLQFILSGMFDLVVRRIMTAFEERARKLYGAPTAAS